MLHRVTRADCHQADVTRLEQFHSAHFPGQKVPLVQHLPPTTNTPTDTAPGDTDNELGYYEDGVKRTLTDDQIAMFRNSEIQRLLQERRRVKEVEEERGQGKRETDENNEKGEEGEKERTHARHLDEPGQVVDALSYDDEIEAPSQSGTSSRTFLWPKLG